ncbi:hypothetical protein [Methylobacterium radiodurans]|uniref:Flagellar FliJ protein n=1 Tax=Methylobacterium radiodurans TaxID=2202828 RepID=A0A2U8VV32_9HYPH|nr:hypothetical protein [Methylobacterium radiodurans]AWN37629.1 hypothetical protein DK427_19435 [Methylobacterium radiodurans]
MAHDPRRLDRAERLMRVQAQMRRVAETELARTRDRAAAIEADRAALVGALGTGQFGHLLLGAADRRLQGLATEAGAVADEIARQAEQLRERGLAEKRAEALVERAAAAQAHEHERREALDRLDGLARRPGDASLP